MDSTAAARVADHLFRGADHAYAVLDAARGPEVYEAIRSCKLPCECLYDGALSPELAEVAPYLVRLRPGAPLLARLLESGWGQSWGCFLAAPLELRELRRHLRRFLRAQTEDHKAMVFRYYDPRVLRVYLPTCTVDELTAFFGDIQRFVVEDAGGQAALSFERDGAALAFSRLALAAA